MLTSPYVTYIVDLLAPFGSITAKAMFGGYGIYKNKIIVAIIVDDELYFKVDATNQAQYEAYDSTPFTYDKNGKQATMSYWKVPAEILENRKELPEWLEQSYQISLKKKKK